MTPTKTAGLPQTPTPTPTKTLSFTGDCVNCNYFKVQGNGYLTYTACSSSTNSYGLIQNSYIDTTVSSSGFIIINVAGVPSFFGSITITQLQPSGLACGTPPQPTALGPTPTNTPTPSSTPRLGTGQRVACLSYTLNTLSVEADEPNVNIYYTDCNTNTQFIQSMAPGLQIDVCSRSFPYLTASTKNVLINTSNNACGSFIINQTPEPTLTTTPTPNLYTVYEVEDCSDGYLYAVSVPTYSGLSIGNIVSFNISNQHCDLDQQTIFKCGAINSILTNYKSEAISISLFNSCQSCAPSITPTVTSTPTLSPTLSFPYPSWPVPG